MLYYDALNWTVLLIQNNVYALLLSQTWFEEDTVYVVINKVMHSSFQHYFQSTVQFIYFSSTSYIYLGAVLTPLVIDSCHFQGARLPSLLLSGES